MSNKDVLDDLKAFKEYYSEEGDCYPAYLDKCIKVFTQIVNAEENGEKICHVELCGL